jgi:ATP-binding cassette subfamily B protein
MLKDSEILTARLRDTLTQLSYLPRTLRLVWGAAQSWTLAWALLLMFQGLLPVVTVYLTRLLVDGLVAAIGAGGSWERLWPVLAPAALMAGVLLLTEFLQSAIEWIRATQAELVQDYISALIHEKSVAVDLAYYESPEYYDRLDRARDEASSRPLALLESGGSLVQNSITLLAMAAVLLPYGAWLPVVLLLSTLPALYVVLRFNWRYHQWWERTTSDRRWTQYYDVMLTHSDIAAELRLFDLGTSFQLAYQTLRRRLRTEHLQLLKAQSLARLTAGLATLLIAGAAMAWMIWRAVQGLVSLGDLALFYQAFHHGQNLMRTLLGNVGQIYANSLFLGNLFEFLDLQPHVLNRLQPISAPSVITEGIRFERITFRYPGSERIALQDFNLTIPAGQVAAIVGANGAGKSTLVKLLCRFYDPEAGQITLDGIDLREMSLDELRRLITVLFQWPVPYHASAGQNIALGDVQSARSAAEIEAAARGAGAHEVIARLPQGYETLLGKWFVDGTELSEGEWQRLALARAFLRRAQIIVLDEPTSFMDSWAEAEWLERFHALVQGRTALLITHRFTTAMRADVIHVMRHGQIVESGSHDALLTQGGLYAQSWAAHMHAGSHASSSVWVRGPHLDGTTVRA